MLGAGVKGFAEELIIDSLSSAMIYSAIYECSVARTLIKCLRGVLALIFLSIIKVIFKTSVPALTYASLMLIVGLLIWVPRTLIMPDQVSIEGSLVLAVLLVVALLRIRLKKVMGEWGIEVERYRAYRLGIIELPRSIS